MSVSVDGAGADDRLGALGARIRLLEDQFAIAGALIGAIYKPSASSGP